MRLKLQLIIPYYTVLFCELSVKFLNVGVNILLQLSLGALQRFNGYLVIKSAQ